MDTKTFFDVNQKLKKSDIIASLNKNKDILEQDYNLINKLLENENDRTNSYRTKTEILLALYSGFISAILGGNFLGIFSGLSKTENGVAILFCSSIFIMIMTSIGIIQLLLIIHPKQFDVVDPTLTIRPHKTTIEWFQDVIADQLSVYRNNLPRISQMFFRIRRSIDCLVLSIFTTIVIIISSILWSFISSNPNKILSIISGIILGVILIIISIYVINIKPRPYKTQ